MLSHADNPASPPRGRLRERIGRTRRDRRRDLGATASEQGNHIAVNDFSRKISPQVGTEAFDVMNRRRGGADTIRTSQVSSLARNGTNSSALSNSAVPLWIEHSPCRRSISTP